MHNIKRLEKNGFLKADNNKRQNQVEINPNTLDGPSKELARKLHQTIKKVTDDIFRFNYNTAISAVMELLNSINKYNSIKKSDDINSGLLFETSKKILQLISPITPFIAEELWEKLGMEYSIHKSTWPEYKPEFAKEEKVTIVCQVNGKIRE